MNSKLIGAILLSAASLTGAIGAIGSQIAVAICLSALYQKGYALSDDSHLSGAPLHWFVIALVAVLATLGAGFLYSGRSPR